METFRLVLFAALTFILFSMWQAWDKDYGSPEPVADEADVSSEPAMDAPAIPMSTDELPIAAVDSTDTDLPVKAESTLQSGVTISVKTDLLDIGIDTHGGDIREAWLIKYPVTIDQPDVPFKLLTSGGISTFSPGQVLSAK